MGLYDIGCQLCPPNHAGVTSDTVLFSQYFASSFITGRPDLSTCEAQLTGT